MKNIKTDSEDSLRPEYKRADFGELVRGKYATVQVDFHQLVDALVSSVGEDEGIEFAYRSVENDRAQQKSGDWTYETDNANQITLRYWLSEFDNTEEVLSNPACLTMPRERAELEDALRKGLASLKTKIAHQ